MLMVRLALKVQKKKNPLVQHAEDDERYFTIEHENNSKKETCDSDCQQRMVFGHHAQINKMKINS